MVEDSSSGLCMGSSSGEIAEGELTIASGSSYSGIAADTVERLVVKMMGFCMMVTVIQCLVS